ncbi:diguanylate cyclase domain-containing protein [Variovorax sp. HJSM1_2]|uniref:sensor domain-containing protein n=1 Tax=Variovorax sp. HJSM1_2 TaxID=3366263 RepID=UPI003BEE848E
MNLTPPATSVNVLDLLVDAVCVVDAEGRYIFVSAAFERIFGYTPQEVIGRRMIELVHPDDRARTLAVVADIMAGQYQLHFENRYLRKDGAVAHIMWSARWSASDGMRVAVARDVTERKRTEALQAAVYAISEAAYAAHDLVALFERIHSIIGGLLPAAHFSVALLDAQTQELQCAYHADQPQPMPHAALAVGEDSLCAEVVRHGRTLRLTPSTASVMAPHLQAAAQQQLHVAPYWLGVPLQGQQGTLGALVLQAHDGHAGYTEKDQELLQFVSTQVATAIERNRINQRLQQMAQYDQLTQLPNRQLFHDRLKSALSRATREHHTLALLFLDLDRFKSVNDSLGHAAGDLLLQGVAARLSACVRASDTVARLGGDEFVLLLESGQHPVSLTSTDTVAEKILAAFTKPFDLAGTSVQIHPSIGMALFPLHSQDAKGLLNHADQAMYACKKAGGNRFGSGGGKQPA